MPLEIPTLMGFNSKKFDIGYRQQITAGDAGYLQTINRATPMWYAVYRTPPLRDERFNAAQAFLDELKGSEETFLAYDPRRPMPWAYRHLSVANDPWTQTGFAAPIVSAYSTTASTITLQRMANGAVVTPGDYISLQAGNPWFLFRVAVGGTAVGNTVTVKVNPRPILPSVGHNIRYRKACAEMKVIGGINPEDSVDSFPSFSFNAFQFVNRNV